MYKARIIYDVFPGEKEWIDQLAKATRQTRISLLRAALDEYRERHAPDLPPRPGPPPQSD